MLSCCRHEKRACAWQLLKGLPASCDLLEKPLFRLPGSEGLSRWTVPLPRSVRLSLQSPLLPPFENAKLGRLLLGKMQQLPITLPFENNVSGSEPHRATGRASQGPGRSEHRQEITGLCVGTGSPNFLPKSRCLL